MSVFGNIAFVAILAASSAPAFASQTHLTDSQYLAAARCQGLIDSPTLGKSDATGINGLMKAESGSRQTFIVERADQERSDAMRLAHNSGPTTREALKAERDGACQVWAKSGSGGEASASGGN